MEDKVLARARQTKLYRLVVALILIQPVMDVLSYWITYAGYGNTITLLLRLVVLAIIVLTGFVLARRKWVYYAVGGVLLLLTAGHVLVCARYGYGDPVADLTNLVRIYQFPATTVAFITFLRREPACMEAIKKGFAGSLGLILLVEVMATVTATDPYTYPTKDVGVLGWFSFANAQSAILSMLVPVVLIWVLERKKFHPVWTLGAGLVCFGILYMFATRLAYAALLGCAFALAASCLIFKVKDKVSSGRAAAAFLVLGIAAVLLVNLSPMAANNYKVDWHAQRKQNDIEERVARDTQAAIEAGLTGQELKVASLKSTYERYATGVVGRFGLERVVEYYNYSTDADIVASRRMEKRAFGVFLMEDQPAAWIFGLELGDITYDGIVYDSENDFHGVYYLCGGVGLALLLLFIGWFLLRILRVLVGDFRRYFTLPAAGFGAALICGLAHAYFTAGVIRRPNANFYLAIILAVVYMLTEKKPSFTEKEAEAQ